MEEFIDGPFHTRIGATAQDLVDRFFGEMVGTFEGRSGPVRFSDGRQNVMPIKSGAKHMRTPKVRDETSVNEREGSRQAVKNNENTGRGIKEALAGREVEWLVREKGYGDSRAREKRE